MNDQTKPKPVHASMDQFGSVDGELQIGGVGVSRLAERAGQTPFYAYDRQLITDRINLLRNAIPEGIHLHYAIKANPMPAVVQHLCQLVDGFDLASAGEMQVALDTTMAPNRISFAGPGKTDRELRMAIAAGIVINMESANEMRRIARFADELGITPKVAIRVNPDYELKASGMKMGGGAKQFGIDAELVPETLKELAALNLEFYGFHIFWGSQNLREEAIMEAHEKTFGLAQRLTEHVPSPVRLFNIGGGLGIPYFPGEHRLDLGPIGENLDRLLPGLKASLPDAEIVTELGRFIVGEAGVYICRVIDKKVSRGEVFLVTDGGLHHHLAASGNFGQVIRKNYPVVIATRMGSARTEVSSVVGPLCTPLDVLASKMELAEADVGDLVAVFQSGAYGFTASPHRFLSHPSPVEMLV
jgi:diaminopimelate decarboxylase